MSLLRHGAGDDVDQGMLYAYEEATLLLSTKAASFQR